jgi:hypothetical protein
MHLPKTLVTFLIVFGVGLSVLIFAQFSSASEPVVLDLHSILGTLHPCSTPGAVQFLSEDEIVVLASEGENCFVADGLQVVAISLDSRIVARHPWESSEVGPVLRPGRLIVPEPGAVTVLDEHLKPIQTLRIVKGGMPPDISVTDTGVLSLTLYGESHFYLGTPLKEIHPPRDNAQLNGGVISSGDCSWQLSRNGSSLIETPRGGPPKKLADLSWVIPPCEDHDLCQTESSSVHFQIVLGKYDRILVTSLGAKFPLTSRFGLVVYFRAQVFDLNTGEPIYQEEDLIRPREHVAALSPEGDRLAVCDGPSVSVHRLK